jgi:hypothetical protein
MTETEKLQKQLAYESARADIECRCRLAEFEEADGWYDVTSAEDDDREAVTRAVRYLDLCGMIRYRGEHELVSILTPEPEAERPSGLKAHALRELKLAGYKCDGSDEEPNSWVVENIFELMDVFSQQGHSGSSAPYVISLFKRLASYECLTPLTGAGDEWVEVGTGIWQNNRCSRVFKDEDGRAYDIEAVVFREPNGACYISSQSRMFIEFPYTPRSEYRDVSSIAEADPVQTPAVGAVQPDPSGPSP